MGTSYILIDGKLNYLTDVTFTYGRIAKKKSIFNIQYFQKETEKTGGIFVQNNRKSYSYTAVNV